jgi:hypothetical protein
MLRGEKIAINFQKQIKDTNFSKSKMHNYFGTCYSYLDTVQSHLHTHYCVIEELYGNLQSLKKIGYKCTCN